jgi:hypothetical protein
VDLGLGHAGLEDDEDVDVLQTLAANDGANLL